MKIEFTCRHMRSSRAMTGYMQQKSDMLATRHPSISSIHIIFSSDNHMHHAEFCIHAYKSTFSIHNSAVNFYASINMCYKNTLRHLNSMKFKRANNKHEKITDSLYNPQAFE